MPVTPLHEITFTTVDPPIVQFALPHTPPSFGMNTQVRWNRTMPLQFSTEFLSYQGTRTRVPALGVIQPWADTVAESQAIERTLAQLRSLAYVSGSQTQIGGLNRPPITIVNWPRNFTLPVVIQDVNVTQTQFFPRTSEGHGAPKRWTVKITMLEWSTTRRTREDVIAGRDGFGPAQGRVV